MHPLNIIQSKMALNHQFTGNTQVVTILRFSASLDINKIIFRLKKFQENYPVFNSSISEKGRVLFFSPSQEALPLFVKCCAIPGKLDIAAEEMAEVIDSKKILWRLRIYCGENNYYAAYTRHHAISDNFTSGLFLGKIFSDLTTQTPAEEPVVDAGCHTVTEVHARSGAPLLRAFNGQLRYSRPVPAAERSTGITSTLCSRELTGKLTEAAKARDESLHSLLAHHYADSVMAYFQLPVITLNTALSVRDNGHDKPGCFIDVVPFTFAQGCSTAAGNAYQHAILAAKNRSLASTLPAPEELGQFATALAQFQQESTDSPLTIAITNNGNFSVKDPAVREIFNVVNRTGANFPIALHISFFASQLQIIFTFPQPFVDRSTIEAINALLITRLEAL